MVSVPEPTPNWLVKEHNAPDWLIDHEQVNIPTILCPVCHSLYTHVSRVHTRFGMDEYEGGRAYEGTVARGTSHDWRRDGLVITFWCEQEHDFELIIQQHKGLSFLLVRGPLTSGPHNVNGEPR